MADDNADASPAVIGTGSQEGTWVIQRPDGSTMETALPLDKLEGMGFDTSAAKAPADTKADDSKPTTWGDIGAAFKGTLGNPGEGQLLNAGIAPTGQPLASLPQNEPVPEPQAASPAPTVTPAQTQQIAKDYTNNLQQPPAPTLTLPTGGGGGGGQSLKDLEEAKKLGLKGLEEDVAAKSDLAQKNAKTLGDVIVNRQQEAGEAQAYAQQIAQAHAANEQFMNQKIADIENAKEDPNHWWNSRSTGQKVGLGISAILAGFASGFAGKENPVLQMMDKNINRDLEAQRNNLANKKASLEMRNKVFAQHMQGLQDEQMAHHSAKAAIYASLADQVEQQKQLATNPLEQARADQLKSELMGKAVAEKQAASLRNSELATQSLQRRQLQRQNQMQDILMGSLGKAPSQWTPQELQAKIAAGQVHQVPGLGYALTKPSEKQMDRVEAMTDAMDSIHRLDKLSVADPKKAEVEAANLTTQLVKAYGQDSARGLFEKLGIPENPQGLVTSWQGRSTQLKAILSGQMQGMKRTLGVVKDEAPAPDEKSMPEMSPEQVKQLAGQ